MLVFRFLSKDVSVGMITLKLSRMSPPRPTEGKPALHHCAKKGAEDAIEIKCNPQKRGFKKKPPWNQKQSLCLTIVDVHSDFKTEAQVIVAGLFPFHCAYLLIWIHSQHKLRFEVYDPCREIAISF